MTAASNRLGILLVLISGAIVQGLIHAPLTAVKRAGPKLVAKDGIAISVENEEIMYSMQVELGVPPQKVVVQVDTGSSELWVNPVCSTAGSQSQQKQCQDDGQYEPLKSKSSTELTAEHGSITYGDGSNATFAYFKDNVTLGDASFVQVFGVATESYDIYSGLIGLGPDLDYGFAKGKPYSLLLNSMAEQGVIDSRAFSLDLHGYDDPEGSIIFGGIDLKKFKGSLAKTDIVVSTEDMVRLTVMMTGVGMSFPNGTTRTYDLGDGNVLLDSGATVCLLAEDLATQILADLNAQKTPSGVFVTDCALRDQPGTVNFEFAGKSIEVPYESFIRDVGPTSDTSLCSVGLRVAPAGSQQILGDSFLRAAYVVFDWDNEEVHLAQATDCGSEIVAIGSGTDAVPSATGHCEATVATASSSSVSHTGTGTSSSTSSITSTTSDSMSSSVLSSSPSSSTPTSSQNSTKQSNAPNIRSIPSLQAIALAVCISARALWGLG